MDSSEAKGSPSTEAQAPRLATSESETKNIRDLVKEHEDHVMLSKLDLLVRNGSGEHGLVCQWPVNVGHQDLYFPLYIKKNKVETEAGNFLHRVGKEREADLLEASALDHQDLSSCEVDLVKSALLISYMARIRSVDSLQKFSSFFSATVAWRNCPLPHGRIPLLEFAESLVY
ncbi:hypothetical protein POTOM_055131 [Populus tomentosa]|uniref:Uncharacterized protein n=1 Tax=Populus tomentosa TaxID=118781 RepID=A0A8X7Y2T7_POPTO|nr:hypothetical protein POTOM_055131 [Populus tomentosa]